MKGPSEGGFNCPMRNSYDEAKLFQKKTIRNSSLKLSGSIKITDSKELLRFSKRYNTNALSYLSKTFNENGKNEGLL